MGGKSSAPASPDYVGLAREQGAQNRETATWNNQLGHVNTNGPYGSTSWDGNTLNTNLSPTEQSKLSNQAYNTNNLTSALQRFYGSNPSYGQSLNFSGAPALQSNVDSATGDAARQQAQDAVYSQYASRLDPQWKQAQTDQETALINKGFDPTSDAYTKQMADFNRNKTDAYQTANNSAVTAGNAAQQQYFQQAVQNLGLNNAARQSYIDQMLQQQSGNQSLLNSIMGYMGVNTPTGASGSQGNAAPTDLTGAAQNQYQANVNNTNVANANASQTWSNIGSMAGIAAMFLSDARHKSNIVKVGETSKGVGVYEYDIQDRRERGVLAQEVEQKIEGAVGTMPDGTKFVDYSKVGQF